MQPKLKGDTFYMPLADGIYLRNNQRTLKIKSKAAYRWLERLAPYLNGQHTLEALTHNLPPEKQIMVNDLVKALLDNGFLKDVSSDRPHTLNTREEQLYGQEIAFIDSFVDSSAYRFEQFRNSNVLLIGSGFTFTALVRASLRSGLQLLTLCPTEENPLDWQHYHEYLQRLNQQGAGQKLDAVPVPLWEDEESVEHLLLPFDTVLFISDRPRLTRTRMLNRLCQRQKKLFIQAVIVDDHAWIGPLIHPGSDSCWECAWSRLQTNLKDPAAQLALYTDPDAASRFIAPPTASIVSNILIFEIFKYLTGIQHLETDKRMLVINLETLETESHAFLPHPCCQNCHPAQEENRSSVASHANSLQEKIQRLEQGSPIDTDIFSQQITTCFDSRFGLLNSLAEEDFVQVPLNISQATISHPMLFAGDRNPISGGQGRETFPLPATLLTTIGVGTSVHQARQRATLRGCELYAAHLLTQTHRLNSDVNESKLPLVEAEWFSPQPLPPEHNLWTWAWNISTRSVCLVPTSLVCPDLCGRASEEETMPGLASGLSWVEAVSQALLKLCKILTLKHILSATEPFPQIDLAALPLSGEAARYRHMLELVGTLPQVYDITGPLQVPTFAFCLDAGTIAYTTHLDLSVAMCAGLEQVVQWYQAQANQQPQYAPSPVPALPAELCGHKMGAPAYQFPLDWHARQAYLLHTLARQGWQPFLVPLHGDPALTAILPYIVHVLLARR